LGDRSKQNSSRAGDRVLTITKKRCDKCQEIKLLQEFPLSNGYYNTYCKICKNKKGTEWYYNNKERSHAWYIKRRYKITKDEWNILFNLQGNKCAICASITPGGKGQWHTDHKGKKVRGILCHGCNTGIGHLKHNIENLKNAIEYLTRSENSK
jgi:hypothetical protein